MNNEIYTPENLWFIGFVGIDERVTIVEYPSTFKFEDWEVLDFMLDDERKPDLGIESSEIGFYKFSLGVESGFEEPHDNEYAFEILDCEHLKEYKIKPHAQ